MKAVIVGNKKYRRKHFAYSVNLFPILMICLCVATSLMMASFFSGVMTTSGFGLIQTAAKTQTATTVWAISVGSATTFGQAEELCQTTQTQGGGGVMLKKELFYVLASAYEMENDAVKVQSNLSSQGVTSEIVKLVVPQTSISTSYTLSEVAALDTALLVYRDAFRSLFDLSVSLDTQTKNETTVRESLDNLIARVEQAKLGFATHLNSKLTANLISLSLQNETTLSTLKTLKASTKPLATMTKHAYLTILIGQMTMLEELHSTVF